MKRFFSTLAGIIIVVALAAFIIGYIYWSRVPDIVAGDLSKKLKVNVQIDDISLGWGKIKIKKVEMGNPPRSSLAKAFSCMNIDILAPLTRYMSRHIVIDEIHVDGVYLGLEFDSATGTKGNWTEIMKNAQSDGKKTASDKTVLIHKLILTRINVDVLYRNNGKVKHLRPIDSIELKEISSEGGLPMDQIMNSVLGQMLKSVFEKENLKNMFQDFIQQPGGTIDTFIGPFKGLLNTIPLRSFGRSHLFCPSNQLIEIGDKDKAHYCKQ